MTENPDKRKGVRRVLHDTKEAGWLLTGLGVVVARETVRLLGEGAAWIGGRRGEDTVRPTRDILGTVAVRPLMVSDPIDRVVKERRLPTEDKTLRGVLTFLYGQEVGQMFTTRDLSRTQGLRMRPGELDVLLQTRRSEIEGYLREGGEKVCLERIPEELDVQSGTYSVAPAIGPLDAAAFIEGARTVD